MRLRNAVFAALVTLLAAPMPMAGAQSYPTRPVRLVVPFAAGGGVDITARLLADPLGRALGQTIVVDNRPGAGSRLGTEVVAKAAPDGYTLLQAALDLAVSKATYKELPYDPLRDFIPISLVAEQANILVINRSIAAKSFQDFMAFARSQPGKLTYGSPGTGQAIHLAMELLLMSQNAKMTHVPFKGTAPALTAVLGNEITAYLSTFASALPHVKADRLRALGVTTAKRVPTLPDVPTLAESGVPGYESSTWYGLVAPAGVRRAIIDQLNKGAVTVLSTPAVKQQYASQGLDTIPSTSAHFAAYLKSEIEKWTKVVQTANIELL